MRGSLFMPSFPSCSRWSIRYSGRRIIRRYAFSCHLAQRLPVEVSAETEIPFTSSLLSKTLTTLVPIDHRIVLAYLLTEAVDKIHKLKVQNMHAFVISLVTGIKALIFDKKKQKTL